MVAISRSENLNPQFWKREQAPVHRNTAPQASQSTVLAQEIAPCPESAKTALAPHTAGTVQNRGQDKLLSSSGSLGLQAQRSVLIQEQVTVTQNANAGIEPRKGGAETIAQHELPVTQNGSQDLGPNSAAGKLDGYEPKFFLKEDGR